MDYIPDNNEEDILLNAEIPKKGKGRKRKHESEESFGTNFDSPNPIIKTMYNETRKVRPEGRGDRNTAQHMFALAVEAKYLHWHEKDPETKQITHLCLAHPEAVKLFRAYYHVVFIYSTYKTNPHKNALVEMVGVTPNGMSFLIGVALLPNENVESYTWLLWKLADLLECIGVSPSVFITDREKGLVGALKEVYPGIDHILCKWHVDKVVEAKSKKLFGAKREGQRVLAMNSKESGWWRVINAPTEEAFQRAWRNFCVKWKEFGEYIENTWGEHAGKFVLCYTNEIFHLGNITTSRVESAHSVLKAWIKSAHPTLDTMWSRIHVILEVQHSTIRKDLEACRSRSRITTHTFSLLVGNVSIMAIELMEAELKRGQSLGIGLGERCGHVIRTTHGLPCACQLVSLDNRGGRVHPGDIHVFWRTLVYDCPVPINQDELDLFDEVVQEVRNSGPERLRAALDILLDLLHPEDGDVLPPPMNENPKDYKYTLYSSSSEDYY